MRFLAFSILLLFGTICQRTDVSVNESQNSNTPIRVATENTNSENSRKIEVNNPFNSDTMSSPANKTAASTNKTAVNSAPSNGVEKRCGWLANPTPANFWLTDADGEWTIGVQGGYQAEGTDYLPDFGNQWVKTNGNYGYGCACMNVTVDKKEQKVVEIKSASVRPLSACRNDKNLQEPEA
jgi:Cu2+-containing amine oxidase